MAKSKYKCGSDGYYRHRETYNGVAIDLRSLDAAELEEKVRQRKNEIDTGERLINSSTTVRQWGEEWHKTYIAPRVGIKTSNNYLYMLEHNVYPGVGMLKLRDVRPVQLQQLLNGLANDGRSGSHIGKLRNTLRQMFAAAVENSLITTSPAAGLKLPKCSDGTHRCLTEDEVKILLDVAAYHRYGLYIILMYSFGLRPQEACALHWEDIDIEKRVLHIKRAVKAGTRIVDMPKTDAGVRDLPIPETVLPRLTAEAEGKSPPDTVLLCDNGAVADTIARARWWKAVRRECNIKLGAEVYRNQVKKDRLAPDVQPYCLRHTYCTNLQRAGVPLNVAKYLMGHSDIRMTANIYTHQTQDVIDAARESINNYNGAEPGKPTS